MGFSFDQLSQFRLERLERTGRGARGEGVFDRITDPERTTFLADLFAGEDVHMGVRFYALDLRARRGWFEVQEGDPDQLSEGTTYACLDGYWGERAALVLDRSRVWQRERFEPRDSIRIAAGQGGWARMRVPGEQPPKDGDVVLGGWDHEHCLICSQKIGSHGDEYGYRDQHDGWACEPCYGAYVEPRRLDFINVTEPFP